MTGLLIALAAAAWSALCLTAGYLWAHHRISNTITDLIDRMGAANHHIADPAHRRLVIAEYVIAAAGYLHRPRLRVRGAR